jgi:hypothetical protein
MGKFFIPHIVHFSPEVYGISTAAAVNLPVRNASRRATGACYGDTHFRRSATGANRGIQSVCRCVSLCLSLERESG